jgi:hypothetical protein
MTVARETSQTPAHVSDNVYAGWLTKDEAATALHVTPKTIERLAAAGKIHQGATQPQGRGPVRAVYHPDDVARLVQERRQDARPFVLPAGVTSPVSGNGHGRAEGLQIAGPELSSSGQDLLRAFAVALRQMSETSQTRAAYVDKTAALAIAGVSYGELREAVRKGEVKQRGVRYRRKDLEAL